MINLDTIKNNSGAKAMIEEILEKTLLERPMRDPVFTGSAYGATFGLPTMEGQFIKLTQKKSARKPQKMLNPGGAGSDPLSGIALNVNQMLVPMEWIQDYAQISHVSQQTSWIDVKNWARDELPEAIEKRSHQLAQNALAVGRYQPGQYDAAGAEATAFDATVEDTVSLYGTSFTFKSAPKTYAGGTDSFAAMVAAGKTTSLDDLLKRAVALRMSGAPSIVAGKYACVLTDAMMYDLLSDPTLNPNLIAALQGGSKPLMKGMEDRWLGTFGDLMFIRDEIPYAENSAAENVREDWGDVHSAFILGKGALGYFNLGGKNASSSLGFKIQDVTKTGFESTIGYMTPHQVATVNSNFANVYKAVVTQSEPNNYSATNTQGIFGGETLGDDV